MKTILVVDDEPKIAALARDYLEHAGFAVVTAADGRSALDAVGRTRPDLVVIDLGLPEIDGLDVTRAIRRDSTLPIVMLTARDDEIDKLLGLELGADDYLTKPFSPRELVARARAVLRRVSRTEERGGRTRIELHDLVLDSTRFEALNKGALVPLTRAEFRLLWALAQRPGRVYSRGELADEITAGESLIIDRNVDVHVSSIRKKLGDAGKVIATVRGVGYKCID